MDSDPSRVTTTTTTTTTAATTPSTGSMNSYPSLSPVSLDAHEEPHSKQHSFVDLGSSTLQAPMPDVPSERFAAISFRQDRFWGYAFLFHLVVLFIFSMVSLVDVTDFEGIVTLNAGTVNETVVVVRHIDSDPRKLSPMSFVIVLLASVLSIVYFVAVVRFHRFIFRGTIATSLALSLMMLIVLFVYGNIVGGIVFLVIFVLSFVFLFLWKQHVEFSETILSSAIAMFYKFPIVYAVAALMMLVQLVFTMIWVGAVAGVLSFTDYGGSVVAAIFLILSFFWFSQVFKYIVHVTVSAVTAAHIFQVDGTDPSDSSSFPRDPAVAAFRRACTTSFGSICFAGMTVSIPSFFRFMCAGGSFDPEANAASRLVATILSLPLRVVDIIVKELNIFALPQIAMYSKSMMLASEDAWELIKEKGVLPLVNDSPLTKILTMGCMNVGIITGLTGAFWGHAELGLTWNVSALVGFFVGFTLSLLLTEVFYAFVTTLFVSFAEDNGALAAVDSYLHDKISHQVATATATPSPSAPPVTTTLPADVDTV